MKDLGDGLREVKGDLESEHHNVKGHEFSGVELRRLKSSATWKLNL